MVDFMDNDKVNERVWFRDWAQALDNEHIDPKRRKLFRNTIFGYLVFCKTSHKPVSIASARDFGSSAESVGRLEIIHHEEIA